MGQCSKYMFDEYLVCMYGFSWLIPQLFYLNLRVSQNSCKNARLPFAPYSLPGFPAETGSASTGVATRLTEPG